ncbi:MAG: transketolase C-terminal domain-containing protein [Propionicimonas sp.]|nr:transketolase C-terminal domain-containing protein [Propionicimonas sp.]
MTGNVELWDCRTAFSQALESLAAQDDRVVVVVNDSVGSSKLTAFAERFPDRIVNVGIAEQDMVGVAAGLASSGMIPFVSAAASFLTARALEQIKVDAAYAASNVKFCGMSPGLAYGSLGPTHHSVEDISWLRAIPGVQIVVPSDPVETAGAVRWAGGAPGPVFLRISRSPVPCVNKPGYDFRPGKAVRLRDGGDVSIIANGTVVWRALEAADELARQQVDARVVSMPTVKPLDTAAVLAAAEQTAGIITVEEASVTGGLGAAVAALLAERHPSPMRILGVPDEFAPVGDENWLMDRYGISSSGIVRATLAMLGHESSVGN